MEKSSLNCLKLESLANFKSLKVVHLYRSGMMSNVLECSNIKCCINEMEQVVSFLIQLHEETR